MTTTVIEEKEHLSRLQPRIFDLLKEKDSERIEFLMVDKWVPYPRANDILNRMDELLHYPEKARMPNLLIVGDINNGKTCLVRRFWRTHPPYPAADGNIIPVVMVHAPYAPDVNALYCEILSDLLVPFRYRDVPAQKENQIKHYFSKIGVKMLIIDEIHNILSGSVPKQRVFMNALKNISNKMMIPIVLVGTKDALRATNTDMQINSRFKPMFLLKWKFDREFAQLLVDIETTLPLKKPSYLATKELAETILDFSEGYIGEIVDLISMAAALAIKNGTERIALKEIKGCQFVKPSARQTP